MKGDGSEYTPETRARMAELRVAAGLRQMDVAAWLGIGQPGYAGMETGGKRFRRRDLVTLAVCYGYPRHRLAEAFPELAGLAEQPRR